MNTAYLEGYISTRYKETRTTAAGDDVTTFQLSSPYKKDGQRQYQYFRMVCWHDENGTQDGIVEGAYAHIECSPKVWKNGEKSGVDFTVRRIWLAPEREPKPAAEPSREAAEDDDDIPF